MELEEIIRKRWEREPLAISDDMTGDFARNDILDLLDVIDRVKAQRDALAAALREIESFAGTYQVCDLESCPDCAVLAEIVEKSRAALALVAADTAGQQEAA